MSDARLALRHHGGAAVGRDAALREQLAEIYADAFGRPPYTGTPESARTWADMRLVEHTGYPGFGLVTAELDDRVAGFGYGLLGGDDQWFTRTVRKRIPDALARQWLGGHGELVELAVRSEARGQGVGGAVHDAVVGHLRSAGAAAALLVVETAVEPARRLYEARGWRSVAQLLPTSTLMGLRLH